MSSIIQPAKPPRAPSGRGVVHGDLSQIAGRPWWAQLAALIVLAAAATVDVVTFHQVLVLAIDETEEVLWAAVGGFVVVVIALSHYAGLQARQATSARNVPGARLSAWLCLVVWGLLGLMAFMFRLLAAEQPGAEDSQFVLDGQVAEVPGSDDNAQMLSAFLFLAFYLGTGVISGLAGFLRFDPAAKQHGRAVARRTQVARRRADSGWVVAAAEEIKHAIDSERRRREEKWERTEREYRAVAARLKQATRPLIDSIRGSRSIADPPARPAGDDPIHPTGGQSQ